MEALVSGAMRSKRACDQYRRRINGTDNTLTSLLTSDTQNITSVSPTQHLGVVAYDDPKFCHFGRVMNFFGDMAGRACTLSVADGYRRTDRWFSAVNAITKSDAPTL